MSVTSFSALGLTDLVVDAVYEGGTLGTAADDPLARMLPVGNQGGFRYRGSPPTPKIVVLLSTGRQPAWPDILDPYTGKYTYFGDNRTPGHQLHDTSRRGNLILADAFRRTHGSVADREGAPVFLVFHSTGVRRDVRFLGLAVPGAQALTVDEDLIAIWRSVEGQRFQNYRATFSILEVPVVPRDWVNQVLDGVVMGPKTPAP